MGLDGISINQLRLGTELNSKELNKVNSQINLQFIDGLAKGQRINADEKKEQNNSSKSKQDENNDSFEEDENDNDLKTDNINNEEIIKYDLSNSNQYMLKVDEKNNNILIIEKNSQKIIQSFNPEALADLTKYLPNFKGVLINRKQ